MDITSDAIRNIIGNNEIYADAYMVDEDFRVIVNTLLDSVDSGSYVEISLNMIYSYMTLYKTVFNTVANVGDPETIKALESVLNNIINSDDEDNDGDNKEI